MSKLPVWPSNILAHLVHHLVPYLAGFAIVLILIGIAGAIWWK